MCVLVCMSECANVCHMAIISNIDFHIAILRMPEAKGARHRQHEAIVGYVRTHTDRHTQTYRQRLDTLQMR